jgi:hypothetical protein
MCYNFAKEQQGTERGERRLLLEVTSSVDSAAELIANIATLRLYKIGTVRDLNRENRKDIYPHRKVS